MGSNIDLRKYQDPTSIEDAFSKIVSGGRPGYKAIIERRKPTPKCSKCGKLATNEDQKFCAECGGKMVVPLTNCPGCQKSVEETEKFCTNCGYNLKS